MCYIGFTHCNAILVEDKDPFILPSQMTWQRKEPGYQETWYRYILRNIRKVVDI